MSSFTYSKKSIDAKFFTMPGFYFFFIPLKVPYNEIYTAANAAGFNLKEVGGSILESGKLFGTGWIGVEVTDRGSNDPQIKAIKGDFEMYEHKGPYASIGKAYKQIKKDRPQAKEFFNLYLDDPKKVKPENLRTQILMR